MNLIVVIKIKRELSKVYVGKYVAGTIVIVTFMEPFNPPNNLMMLDTLISFYEEGN